MPDLQGDIAGQVLLAVRILSGTLAAVFAFAGVLVFSMQGRAWPWFSCLPGLDLVWMLSAPFAKWGEVAEGRVCLWIAAGAGFAFAMTFLVTWFA
jgi:hypothetical protein